MNFSPLAGRFILHRDNRSLGTIIEVTKTTITIDWRRYSIRIRHGGSVESVVEEYIFVSPESYKDLYELL